MEKFSGNFPWIHYAISKKLDKVMSVSVFYDIHDTIIKVLLILHEIWDSE